jgi:hypothetical protein
MSKIKSGTQVVSAHRRRKDKEPLTPEMALTLLESAVSYCQAAGLHIQAANSKDGTLGLFVPGAHYIITDNGTRAFFRLGELPEARAFDGTIIAKSLPARASAQ